MKSTKKETNGVSAMELAETSKRHEHAMIVVLAYIIGFVTALIAFHIGKNNWPELVDYSGFKSQVGYHSHDDVDVVIKEGSLFAIDDRNERIISAYSATDTGLDGFHYRIINASVSPKGHYVHYCVQLTAQEESCYNFVYSIDKDTVYRVTSGDGQVMSELEGPDSVQWTKDERLMIGDTVSSLQGNSWIVTE